MNQDSYQQRKNLTWSQGVVVVLLLLVIGVFIFPILRRTQRHGHERLSAISNAKQIFLLLIEFDDDYGEFPSDKTAGMPSPFGEYSNGYEPEIGAGRVADIQSYRGKYSNDYLGQLLAVGYVDTEEIFYARGGSASKHRPDNDFSTRAKTLEAGECGFAYVKGLSSTTPAETPLLMAAMVGSGYQFNSTVYKGKAMVLHMDGSVKTYTIDANGDVVLKDGKKLFEDGTDTVWGVDGFKKEMLLFPK